MSVRFTPGLDDLAHPVRDAKLLAHFWPFFCYLRAARKPAWLHAGLEETEAREVKGYMHPFVFLLLPISVDLQLR
jgi:hypothetical protein